MTRLSIIAGVAITLCQPLPAVGREKHADAAARPSSFVPHPHTRQHVHGAPIARPIVGHRQAAHRRHTPKK